VPRADTFRTAGFVPHVPGPERDGARDLLLGAGDKLEIRLAGRALLFRRVDATQKVETAGKLRISDLDGDGSTTS
jgi:hypothetical protein